MIENPGETPDFAIFASLNKDGAFPAWCVVTGPCELIPRQYAKAAASRRGCHVSAATVATSEATDASGWRKIEGGGGKESPAGSRAHAKGGGVSSRFR